VQHRIERMRHHAEREPDEQIAGDEKRDQQAPIAARRGQPVKAMQQRQHGGQHHCRDHQQPAASIEQTRQ
jgi:hypothetical protein